MNGEQLGVKPITNHRAIKNKNYFYFYGAGSCGSSISFRNQLHKNKK